MNLRDARDVIREEHIREAFRLLEPHDDFEWLYERTGRKQPQYRYIVVNGRRLPSKAFGFLVAQIALNTTRKENDMNVNEAVAPLKRLGLVEVTGPESKLASREKEASRQSYYQALARPQQALFRRAVMALYDGTCAISGCRVEAALEAAHVQPFSAKGEDSPSNGILLRADLHRLFDANELALNPSTLLPAFSKSSAEHYASFAKRRVSLPSGGPVAAQFKIRWAEFKSHS